MIVRNAVMRISLRNKVASRQFMTISSRTSLQQSQTVSPFGKVKSEQQISSSVQSIPILPSLQILRTYASSTLKFKQASISEDEYHVIADSCFDSLTESLEELVEEYDGPDADSYELEFASGVLTLKLGSHGTYVINKQPPNKQIWFSSPSSGPKRFDYDASHNEWFMHKDGEEWNFRKLFNRELSEIFGKYIEINFGN